MSAEKPRAQAFPLEVCDPCPLPEVDGASSRATILSHELLQVYPLDALDPRGRLGPYRSRVWGDWASSTAPAARRFDREDPRIARQRLRALGVWRDMPIAFIDGWPASWSPGRVVEACQLRAEMVDGRRYVLRVESWNMLVFGPAGDPSADRYERHTWVSVEDDGGAEVGEFHVERGELRMEVRGRSSRVRARREVLVALLRAARAGR